MEHSLGLNIPILYGSQTGTSRDVADEIHRLLRRLGLRSRTVAMNDYNITELPEQNLAIFVCSTTGQGEVPDNMKKFWRNILNKRLPNNLLSKLRFAVFGLGDSGYVKFNYAGKMLFNRLGQLGAQPIVRRGDGDDQHRFGLYGELFPWLKSLTTALWEMFPTLPRIDLDRIDAVKPAPRCEIVLGADHFDETAHQPCFPGATMLRVVSNQRLTAPDWEQDVRHVVFDSSPAALSFAPGDVIYIQPQNSVEEVERFSRLFDIDFRTTIVRAIKPNSTLDSMDIDEDLLPTAATYASKALPMRLDDVVRNYLDISGSPKRYFFELLSHFATDQLQKERLMFFASQEGAEEMYDYSIRSRRNYSDVLSDFHSARPPIEYLFDLIPSLQPRPFSISSSQLLNPTTVQISMAVVKYKSPINRLKKGVFSNWLASVDPSSSRRPIYVAAWIKRGTLPLPPNPEVPVIMVGPGTGCAIFRAFLQHRLALKQQGVAVAPSAFFFGCRHRDKDFIYSDEWNSFVAAGILQIFDVAFSRDSPPKRVYVQNVMLNHSSSLWQMLQSGASFFLSGRAQKMPTDVRAALRQIIQQESGINEDAAEEYIKTMERQNRYGTETWS